MKDLFKITTIFNKKMTKEKIESHSIISLKKIIYIFKHQMENTVPVFIMGYGRSGSTMLFKIFERDFRFDAFGENHPAVAENYMLRYDCLQRTIRNSKYKAVVCKPILNSLDISKLMSIYPNGVYIWLVRYFQDVVASAIKKFGPTVANYLKNYIKYGTGENWISKTLPDDTRKQLQNITKDLILKSEDWMSLVWWAVNSTIIKEKLYDVNNLYIIHYEDLVVNPNPVLNEVYRATGIVYQQKLGKYVHKKSVGKGGKVDIHKKIYQLCRDLDNQISKLNKSKQSG